MTVKELKQAIDHLPDHMDILVNDVDEQRDLMYIDQEFEVKEIPYREDPCGEDLCRDRVLILKVRDQF